LHSSCGLDVILGAERNGALSILISGGDQISGQISLAKKLERSFTQVVPKALNYLLSIVYRQYDERRPAK
jgi:hypothetical protein